MSKHYKEVDPSPDFPTLEKNILQFWKNENVFEASIDQRKYGDEAVANNEFVFYDGPPFANGLPHYGHLLTGFVKDAIARYQTMRGKCVERRFGWDCHGLPAEMGSEKELGISGRAAITEFGIGKFNEHCRTSVMKYTNEWEAYVNRQARWVDFKNDYKTMDKNFMESVLWAFKQLYEKSLVYEAHRVMPYSWAAETPLSNFETKLDNSYREREDKAITVAFKLNEAPKGAPKADKYYVLAWTTTPWTLPSNLALAVGGEMEYVTIRHSREGGNPVCYILAASAVGRYAKELGVEEGQLLDSRFCGNDMVGLTYKPLFPYFKNHPNAFRILDGSSFVTDGDGTGIVHMAPGFGEDDQKACEANGIELVVPVDGQGKYTDEIFDIEVSGFRLQASAEPRNQKSETFSLRGLNVIAEPGGSKFGLANDKIIDYLKQNGVLIKQEQIKHNYPHCWRTDTPLIYRAMPSWYVEVTKFRDRAVEINQQINWIPEHIRDGQMAHMLATAPDWSISRNRFWGTPIPVWRSKSGKIIVIGSIEELENISGKKVHDLHRPYIDEIKIIKDGEEYTRVEDVFDCWFESGSMPFAQVHYPFENKEWFESHFPADFITEYVGQTRGWFNTLIMLSTALFDKPPFLNCICHGVVLDSETGNKYSKRLKNYKDPMEVMDKYGADALRWLMLSSPVMRGQDLSVDPDGKFIRDVVRLAIKPIWNAYNFFVMYANADGVVVSGESLVVSEHLMDKYILAKCSAAVSQVKASMDAYDTPLACEAITQFFEVLNNWYIRRSKERFWKEEKDTDKQAAYDTLYTVLVTMCRAGAALLPYTFEEIYKNLTGNKSVHLAGFPDLSGIVEENLELMDRVRDVCNAALSVRSKLNIRVRQPLKELRIEGKYAKLVIDFGGDIIRDEVNVKKVTSANTDIGEVAVIKLSLNNPVLGKRLPEKMKQIIPAAKKGEWEVAEHNLVKVCGEVLRADEFSIQFEPKPEFKDCAQALATNDALVILDTEITEELKREGLARDLVRAIQQARKDANLNVSDRIHLGIEGVKEIIEDVVLGHYIKAQTLAVEISNFTLATKTFETKASLDDISVTITLAKAA